MKFKVGHICEKEWGQHEQSLETESTKNRLLDCYAVKSGGIGQLILCCK